MQRLARNLVRAGLDTTIWDRTAAATEPLTAVGARAAASPAEAVAGAGVLITILPDADAVASVMLGEAGEAFADRAVWAQMDTIGVPATLDIAARLGGQRPDVLFVDAPVSGSRGPAEHGQLLILASGPPAAEPSCARYSTRSAARPSGSATPAPAAG